MPGGFRQRLYLGFGTYPLVNGTARMYSHTEENYIKAIYRLSKEGTISANTNAIAEILQTKAASVTDMLRKLAAKGIINYVKYQGVTLTPEGQKVALQVVRKHRLWEVFLVEKLQFNWDEVHELAEELEHIHSDRLIQRLDQFLGFPQFDPHGDPIPTEDGVIRHQEKRLLASMEVNDSGIVSGVKDTQPLFLQYLDKIGIYLGARVQVTDKALYDHSLEISIDHESQIRVSRDVSQNIYITR